MSFSGAEFWILTPRCRVTKAEDIGARFAYGTNIEGLDIESGRVRGVITAYETLIADAVIVEVFSAGRA
jgi:glycine/D-amino acid oxidase-like deaminating enzyme